MRTHEITREALDLWLMYEQLNMESSEFVE
jgi:hypothetical protein